MTEKELDITQGYTDFSEMLEKAKLDAVVIVTSSSMHYQHTIQAFSKRLHVFCEKPIGISPQECHGIEEVVNANSELVYMPGFMRRYDPSYAYVRKKIEEGYIGKPILYRGYSVDPESDIEGALKYVQNGTSSTLRR